MSSRPCDVAIIGAGPYGLAAAAHLRASSVHARVFGSAMDFWQLHMPAGMFLRSHWDASHIADPSAALTLDAFERAHERHISQPIPLEDFVSYGRWYQQVTVPDLDTRRVERVEAMPDGFRLTLEDGEPIDARRVVIAAGIEPFRWRPPQFEGLPTALCSHSSDHADLSHLANQRVLVVGGGQSAFECAVLLAEAGATVEVVVRAPTVFWLGRTRRIGTLRRLLYPRTDVGPAFLGHVSGRPSLFRLLPRDMQRDLARLSIRPAAAGWLRPRARALTITTGRAVTSASHSSRGVRIQLDDGSVRDVDHVVLATGYRVDVARYRFLAPVVSAVRRVDGYPELDAGFQSSARGLYFLGAPAAYAFGPVVRFVSGTAYAGRALARSVTQSSVAATDQRPVDRAVDLRASERRTP